MKSTALGLGLLVLFWATPAAGQMIIRQEKKAKAAKPAQPAPPDPWEVLKRRFDLDKDGTITWEEYQKVTSGFTALDADGDGKITHEDLAKRRAPQAGAFPPPGAQVLFLGGPAATWQWGPVQHRAMWFAMPGPSGGMAFSGPGMMQRGGFFMPGMRRMGPWGAMRRRPWMRRRGMRRMWGGPPWMRRGMYGMGPWGWTMQGAGPWEPGAQPPAKGPGDAPFRNMGTAAQGGDNAVRMARFLLAPAADKDGNGEITSDEWKAFVKSLQPGDDGVIAAGALAGKLKGRVMVRGGPGAGSFFAHAFDRDQDGKLEAEDLEAIFKALDRNGDKKLAGDEIGPAGMIRFTR